MGRRGYNTEPNRGGAAFPGLAFHWGGEKAPARGAQPGRGSEGLWISPPEETSD